MPLPLLHVEVGTAVGMRGISMVLLIIHILIIIIIITMQVVVVVVGEEEGIAKRSKLTLDLTLGTRAWVVLVLTVEFRIIIWIMVCPFLILPLCQAMVVEEGEMTCQVSEEMEKVSMGDQLMEAQPQVIILIIGEDILIFTSVMMSGVKQILQVLQEVSIQGDSKVVLELFI